MPVFINGSTGISGTDGTAGTPAVQGTDTNTGVFFPAADTIAFAEGGVEAMRIDSSGNVGIGTSTPAVALDVGNPASATNTQIRVNSTGGSRAELFINSQGSSSVILVANNSGSARFGVASGTVGIAQDGDRPFVICGNSAERMRIDTSSNLQFNSGYGSVATAYGCRAWVNFNGTGVVAIRASGNVSSITDNGTGDYTVNFTTAMPDANYSVSASAGADPVTGSPNTIAQPYRVTNALTTSSVRVSSGFSNSAASSDFLTICVAVFR